MPARDHSHVGQANRDMLECLLDASLPIRQARELTLRATRNLERAALEVMGFGADGGAGR